jgi:hypothetical protein
MLLNEISDPDTISTKSNDCEKIVPAASMFFAENGIMVKISSTSSTILGKPLCYRRCDQMSRKRFSKQARESPRLQVTIPALPLEKIDTQGSEAGVSFQALVSTTNTKV